MNQEQTKKILWANTYRWSILALSVDLRELLIVANAVILCYATNKKWK